MLKFSVIVPVYNASEYLPNCIESVIKQSYQNYELLLIDDGSTDGSEKICDSYARRNMQISVYHKENSGQLHSREFGTKKATGDYFVFLDADDELTQDALMVLQTKILKYQCDCVIFRLERVWQGNALAVVPPMEDQYITDKRLLYKKCLFSNNYNSMCTKVVKASVFLNNKDYSDSYHIRLGEDLLQSLSVYKNCAGILFIGDVLYRYTMNPNSVVHTRNFNNYTGDFFVREKVLQFLKDEAVLRDQDYIEYHSACVLMYTGEIMRVSGFRTSLNKKVEILRKMRNSQYYQDYICAMTYDKAALKKKLIVFELHRRAFDRLAVCIVKLYSLFIKLTSSIHSRTGKAN